MYAILFFFLGIASDLHAQLTLVDFICSIEKLTQPETDKTSAVFFPTIALSLPELVTMSASFKNRFINLQVNHSAIKELIHTVLINEHSSCEEKLYKKQEESLITNITKYINSIGDSITLDNFMQLLFKPFNLSYEAGRSIVKNALIAAMKFEEPSSEVRTLVEEALQNCNITGDIIILEDPHRGTGYTAAVAELGPYRFIIVTSRLLQNNLYKYFVIYHECGHLYHRHSSKSALLSLPFLAANLKAFWKADEIVGRVGNIGIFLIPVMTYLIGAYGVIPMFNRPQEKQADLFSCDMLLKLGRPDAIVERIVDGLLQPADLVVATLDTHYSKAEQSRYLTECFLQASNLTFKDNEVIKDLVWFIPNLMKFQKYDIIKLIIKSLLNSPPSNFTHPDIRQTLGDALFNIIRYHQDYDIFKLILELLIKKNPDMGFDINSYSPASLGDPLLSYVILNMSPENKEKVSDTKQETDIKIIKLLVSHGANPNSKFKNKPSALSLAKHNHLPADIIALLEQHQS